jgi:hypothetical protein
MYALPFISRMFDGIRQYRSGFEHLKRKVQERKNFSRKEFAIAFLSEYGKGTAWFALAMALFESKEPDGKIIARLVMQKVN